MEFLVISQYNDYTPDTFANLIQLRLGWFAFAINLPFFTPSLYKGGNRFSGFEWVLFSFSSRIVSQASTVFGPGPNNRYNQPLKLGKHYNDYNAKTAILQNAVKHNFKFYPDSGSNISVIITITQRRKDVFIFTRIDILLELVDY